MKNQAAWPDINPQLIQALEDWIGRYDYQDGHTMDDVHLHRGKEFVLDKLKAVKKAQDKKKERNDGLTVQPGHPGRGTQRGS